MIVASTYGRCLRSKNYVTQYPSGTCPLASRTRAWTLDKQKPWTTPTRSPSTPKTPPPYLQARQNSRSASAYITPGISQYNTAKIPGMREIVSAAKILPLHVPRVCVFRCREQVANGLCVHRSTSKPANVYVALDLSDKETV